MNTQRSPRPLLAVGLGGLLAGIGDLGFAFIYYGLKFGSTPAGILRSVARGWLGPDEAKIGNSPLVLGFLFHFLIATGVAAVFWLASRLIPALLRWPVITGLLYGGIVYLVMNWVVVPMSAFGGKGGFPQVRWPEFVGHMLLVGLPVALAVAKFAPVTTASKTTPASVASE